MQCGFFCVIYRYYSVMGLYTGGNKLQYVVSVGSGYQHQKGPKVLLTTKAIKTDSTDSGGGGGGAAYIQNGVNVSNLMETGGGLIFGGGLYSEVYGTSSKRYSNEN